MSACPTEESVFSSKVFFKSMKRSLSYHHNPQGRGITYSKARERLIMYCPDVQTEKKVMSSESPYTTYFTLFLSNIMTSCYSSVYIHNFNT
jgi:hypothetical protein